eukprot:3603800-Amphidinium_carterae.1
MTPVLLDLPLILVRKSFLVRIASTRGRSETGIGASVRSKKLKKQRMLADSPPCVHAQSPYG